MADDVTLPLTGSGDATAKVATDEHATRGHMQLVKLAYSADGDATLVTADASGLKVNLGADNDVTVAGVATAANQSTANTALSAIQTAVELLDNAISGTEMQVDIVANATDFATETTLTNIANGFATEGSALASGVLLQGDDGTDRTNVLVDTAGHLQVDVLTGGGGTEYNEDDPTPNPIVGSAVLVERDDALSALTPIEGDWASLRCDANGALWIIPSGTVTVDGSGVTQPISAVSLPLPADASTATLQSTANTALSAIQTAVEIIDDAVAAEGAALGSGILLQGDDGTDRTNVLVDTDGHLQVDIISGSSSGTEFNEDAAASGGEAGPMILGVRRDADTTPVTTDGDFHTLIFDNAGNLKVNVKVDGSGAATETTLDAVKTAVEIIDDAVATEGSALGSGVLIQGDDGTDRTNVLVDAAGHLQVDVLSGGGGGTQYAVDDALGATPTGTLAIGIRDDALSALTPVEGDAIGLRVDANGALWVIPSGTVTVDASGTAVPVTDNGANLSVDWGGTVPPIGAGTEAAALRVTLATDSTGVVSIDDNAGSLTVDSADLTTIAAAVATEGSALGSGVLLQGDDGTDRTNVLVDTDGHLQVDVLSGGGGGTQYAVDTALGATPTGTLAVAIRDDALSALTPVEGDAIGLRVDANGALWVIPSGTVTVDGSGVTQPISAASLPLPTGAATEATLGSIQTAVELIDNAISGTEMQVDIVSGNVTNTGTFAVQEDGAALTALQLLDNIVYSEDVATPATIVGAAVVMERDDALSAVTPIEGDWIGLRGDANGALWTAVNNTVTVDGSGVTQPISAASLPLPSGASTSANQSTANTALSAIQTAVELIDNAISGTEMQVDVVAALPTGANTIGEVTIGAASTAAGDLAKARDSALGATDVGVMALAVRDDALTTLTPADGDFVPFRVSSTGALHVTGGGGGTEYTEDDAAPANPVGTASLMERDDALGGLTPIAGDWSHMFCDANGALWTAVNNTVAVTDDGNFTLAANDGVDIGDVDVQSVTPGTGAGNLGKQVDNAATDTDTGVAVLAKRDDALSALGPVENDYVQLRTDANGALWVIPSGTVTVDGSAVTQPVSMATNTPVGNVAHDAVDSGNPLKVGFQARTTNPTAVANADRVNAIADDVGRQIVSLNAPRDLVTQQTTDTTNTSETTIVTAGGAGVFLDITSLAITNASATATVVTLKDSTAGTTRGKYALAANGGIVLNFLTPFKQGSANNNWTGTSSATVNLHYVAQAIQNV